MLGRGDAMLEMWMHVVILFGTGVSFGIAVGGGAMFKAVAGRAVQRPFPGERHFKAAGALLALFFALQSGLTLTGTERGLTVWTILAVLIIAAIAISILGRRAANLAMRKRHAEELRVLNQKHGPA